MEAFIVIGSSTAITCDAACFDSNSRPQPLQRSESTQVQESWHCFYANIQDKYAAVLLLQSFCTTRSTTSALLLVYTAAAVLPLLLLLLLLLLMMILLLLLLLIMMM
jgi:hypothetical protein